MSRTRTFGALRSGMLKLAVTMLASVAIALVSACAQLDGWGGAGWSRDNIITSSQPPQPMREYRGVWVASVGNIDWPSKPGLNVEDMRREIGATLDAAREIGLNAVFLQVRPACDALYESSYEPWSYYLTGRQGIAPSSSTGEGFDPLTCWIDGAHQRGMELHAWINPFRARPKGAKYPLAETHIARARPDLVREYDDALWLDPGEPEAVEHSLRVLDDLVRRYDIDGLHFDDYFYPYPVSNLAFPDDASFAKYRAAGGRLERAAWRRSNIDGFVERVYDQTKHARQSVRVSVSPFGIWRPNNPKGVQGFDAYEGLHADSRRWLCEGWLDMAIPQLYWKIDAKKQAYGDLLNWWLSQNACGRLVVVGNYSSRINDTAQSWQPVEIVNQIDRTRRAQAGGNVHFSAVALVQNRKGLADALKEGVYAEPAIPPRTPWLSSVFKAPGHPQVWMEEYQDGVSVEWAPGRGDHEQHARLWVVQERRSGRWVTRTVGPSERRLSLEYMNTRGELEALAIAECDRDGRLSPPTIIRTAANRQDNLAAR